MIVHRKDIKKQNKKTKNYFSNKKIFTKKYAMDRVNRGTQET